MPNKWELLEVRACLRWSCWGAFTFGTPLLPRHYYQVLKLEQFFILKIREKDISGHFRKQNACACDFILLKPPMKFYGL
jgi:hypothetical protein